VFALMPPYSQQAIAACNDLNTPLLKLAALLLSVHRLSWLQDVFALMPRYSQRPAKEETINDPTVTKHYWRYRCVTMP
jgi:hypothetical protein